MALILIQVSSYLFMGKDTQQFKNASCLASIGTALSASSSANPFAAWPLDYFGKNIGSLGLSYL